MRTPQLALRTKIALTVALLASAGSARAGDFMDSFSGSSLGSFWEVFRPGVSASVSMTDQPGVLRITVPANSVYDATAAQDLAPEVRVPAPPGDWTAEVNINLPDDPAGSYQAGLAVQFSKGDDAVWGPYATSRSLRATRTGAVKAAAQASGEPICLRIQKSGSTYHYLWRELTGDQWTDAGTDTTGDTPLTVGVIVRTWSKLPDPVIADYSMFDLSGAGVTLDPSKGRIVAHITNEKGAPVPDAWAAVRDAAGHLVGGFATRAGLDGRARVFNLDAGAYSVVALHPWLDSAAPQTVTVSAGVDSQIELKLATLPNLTLSRSGVGSLAPGGWKLLPLARNSETNKTALAYLDPSKPGYSQDTGSDPKYNLPWMQNVAVPGNLATTNGTTGIQNQSISWLRLDLQFPAAWSTFAGRDLVLDSFNVDDEDITYWNGHPVGQLRANVPNSWTVIRNYTVPAANVDYASGKNALAIEVFQGYGGAGITSTAPRLRVPSGADGSATITLTDQNASPVPGVTVSLAYFGGAFQATGVTGLGPLTIPFLPEGDYMLSLSKSTGLDPFVPQMVTIQRQQVNNLSVSVRSVPSINLTSDSLDGAQVPAWALLPIPGVNAAQAATDLRPVDPAYDDSGKDPVYKTDWFQDVKVPADFGQGMDKTNPIDNNSYFWYRLHVTIPQNWSDEFPDRDLVLTGFNMDDSDQTYFNGQLIGSTQNQPNALRTYAVPRSLVRFGQDNIIAIQGHQLTGPAGFTRLDSVPTLAVQTLQPAPVTPPTMGTGPGMGPAPAIKGDLNGNGSVDVADATLALRIAIGLMDPTPAQLAAGDLKGAGRIDIADATVILRTAIGLAQLP